MLLAQDVLTLLAGPMAAAGASNCNITGAWCDVLGRCRTAAIDIRAAHCGGGAGCAIGCEGSPFGWGLVALVPGATLRVELDLQGAARTEAGFNYLASYALMGVARVRCLGGCGCDTLEIDAHRPGVRASTWVERSFVVLRSDGGGPCALLAYLTNATSSGGTRFSLRRH